MQRRQVLIVIVVIIVIALLTCAEGKKRKHKRLTKATNKMVLRQKETNAVDFIRLAVMRLIYGIASRFGLGEQISGALNGAFVPPGVDEYSDYGGDDDDGGFDLLDRDDDDYDY